MTQTSIVLDKLFQDFYKKLADKNMTQNEAAKELEITRSHLNKVINKKTTPSLKLIQKLEEFCYGK